MCFILYYLYNQLHVCNSEEHTRQNLPSAEFLGKLATVATSFPVSKANFMFTNFPIQKVGSGDWEWDYTTSGAE